MVVDVTKVTDICVRLEITFEEFFLLYLIYNRDFPNLSNYTSNVDGVTKQFLKKMETLGLVIDTNTYTEEDEEKEDVIYASKVIVQSKFADELFINPHDAYQEFIDVFPFNIMTQDGKKFNARNISNDIAQTIYYKKIKGDIDLHKRVVELTKRGKELGLIDVGLEKYLDHEKWKAIEEVLNVSNPGEDIYGGEEL